MRVFFRITVMRLPSSSAFLVTVLTFTGGAHAASRGTPPVASAASVGVPRYNIEAACRAAASMPEARLSNVTGLGAIKHCLEAENEAHTKLEKEWFPIHSGRAGHVRRRVQAESGCCGLYRAGNLP